MPAANRRVQGQGGRQHSQRHRSELRSTWWSWKSSEMDRSRERKPMSADPDHGSRKTVEVSPELFRQVYDSPNSLPGKDQWVTPDEDVRRLEQLLGMNVGTIGAPLWVSADNRNCESCERTVSWLDIVASALLTCIRRPRSPRSFSAIESGSMSKRQRR